MPVIYVNLSNHDCTTREPYISFLKKFELIKNEDINGEQIELRVANKDGTFANGFYNDSVYYKNPRLRIDFATLPLSKNNLTNCTLIRATYSYEGVDDHDQLEFHIQRVKNIKKRTPYYYLPNVTCFEFSSQIDDEYKLIFDVSVNDYEKVSDVCCSLISLFITIFSLDD